MIRFKPKSHILPKAQQSLWPSLSFTKDMGMVLYGGTAIALQLGHRQSVDFDFFTDRPLNINLITQQPCFKDSVITQNEVDSLSMDVRLPDGLVKVSFFGGIDIGRVGNPLITEDEVLIVANKQDLLATKLATIHQRIERKDYIDIISLLKDGIPLSEGIQNAKALYGDNRLSTFWTLKTLTYFDEDLELTPQEKDFLITAAEAIDIEVQDKLPTPHKELSLGEEFDRPPPEPEITL